MWSAACYPIAVFPFRSCSAVMVYNRFPPKIKDLTQHLPILMIVDFNLVETLPHSAVFVI